MKIKLKISTGEIITGFPTHVACVSHYVPISQHNCWRRFLDTYTLFNSYDKGYIVRFKVNGKWYFHYSLEPINTAQRLIEKCLWQSID